MWRYRNERNSFCRRLARRFGDASDRYCCSRTGEAGGEVVPAAAIGLTVTNDNFLDMDVDAISNRVSTRLGMVTGNGHRTFTLNPSLASRDLRIVATPIGGNGRASTGEVTVSPGQVIDFRIGSVLQNSTVTIRPT